MEIESNMKKTLRILTVLSIAASSIIFATPSQAAVQFDTTDLLASTTDTSCTGAWLASNSFKFRANNNVKLSKIQVNLYRFAINSGEEQSLKIYSDSSNNLGSDLGTLSVTSHPQLNQPGIATYIASNPIDLVSGNYYWVETLFYGACYRGTSVTYSGTDISLNINSGSTVHRYSNFYLGSESSTFAFFAPSTVLIPDAPTTVSATSTGATTANVSFTAPASNGGATITSYTATSSPGGITGSISQAGSGTIAMTGLTAGTAYTFTVTATNSAGTSAASSASNSATTVGAPTVPTSVVATATGKRSATVSFGAPASNGGSAVTSYTATSTPGGITQTLTQATGGTFTFDGLQPSTAYNFAITAKNAIGTSSAVSSNSVTTTPLEVASLSALSFADDGTGTAGKIVWAGMNVDRVLYTGPAQFYPGPFKYGAFTSGWNGLIRNLTPDTTYTVSINAHSADGVGGEKSLTFKTNAASTNAIGTNVGITNEKLTANATTGISVFVGLGTKDYSKLFQLNSWLRENTFVSNESENMYGLLKKFFLLETSPSSTVIKVPTSRVSNVVATSLTPKTCSVISATAAVDAGLVTALSSDTCTISYTVTGGSSAPATMVRDFVFSKYVSSPQTFACGKGTYIITAGVVSAGNTCSGALTIDASATSIAYGALQGSAITSVSIPNSVKALPTQAFANCSSLTKVELGNEIVSIGGLAFAGTSITSISLPSSLRTLGFGAFYSTALTSLTIPVGTTSIDWWFLAFSNSLTEVTIPNTVTNMHEHSLILSEFKTVNYCGNNASVLAAIAKQPISATCVAPATAP
jgi:hypothetical protein